MRKIWAPRRSPYCSMTPLWHAMRSFSAPYFAARRNHPTVSCANNELVRHESSCSHETEVSTVNSWKQAPNKKGPRVPAKEKYRERGHSGKTKVSLLTPCTLCLAAPARPRTQNHGSWRLYVQICLGACLGTLTYFLQNKDDAINLVTRLKPTNKIAR